MDKYKVQYYSGFFCVEKVDEETPIFALDTIVYAVDVEEAIGKAINKLSIEI